MINYVIDKTKSIESIFELCIKKYKKFRYLRNLRFIFTFKIGDLKYDRDGIPIEAFAKKLPPRERDLYEKDVEICVFKDLWSTLTNDKKNRLIFRTLLSIQIELNESFKIVYDDDERIMFRIVPPDIILRVFSEEIRVFGLPPDSKQAMKALSVRKD